MADDFGFTPSVRAEDVGFEPMGTVAPKKSSIVKEATGMLSGAVDIAAGVAGMPISGLAGLAGTVLPGPAGQGAQWQQKAAETLTPTSALEKMGANKEYLSGSGTHEIMMKIMSAPHEYLSVPIADKYHEITGDDLGAAVLQGGLDLAAYALAFKAGGAAIKATGPKGRDAKVMREELGYDKPVPEVPMAKRNQADFGFEASGSVAPERPQIRADEQVAGMAAAEQQTGFRGSNRGGGLLPDDIKARLEQELNPPTEQRVQGQGELFTGEQAFPNQEHLLGPAQRGLRDRPVNEPGYGRTLQQVGEFTEPRGQPYEMMGQERRGPDRPIELTEGPTPADRQIVRDYERFQQTKPIEPEGLTPGYRPMGPKSQRGVIDPDLLTLGVSKLIRDLPVKDVINKFKGTFSPKSISEALTELSQGTHDIVFMRPKDFLDLAAKRPENLLRGEGGYQHVNSLTKRDSIRRGLETEEGLRSIPELMVSSDGRVLEHNGRHRMDVFEENGLDLIPVKISGPGGTPHTLKSQIAFQKKMGDGSHEIPYPTSARDRVRQENVFNRNLPKPIGPRAQMGMINPEIITDLLKRLSVAESIKRQQPNGDTVTGPLFNKAGFQVKKELDYVKTQLENNQKALERGIATPEDIAQMDRQYERILKRSELVIKEAETQFRPIGPKSQLGHLGSFERDANKKGVVGSLMDYRKQFNVETRPLEKIIADEKITGKTLEDVAGTDISRQSRLDQLWEKGLSNAAIDKTLSILAASKGQVGNIIKWAVDSRRAVTREKDARVAEREHAVLDPWLKLRRQSSKELQEMKEIWQDNVGKEKLTRESFKSERQWETFSKIQEVIGKGWEEVNKLREQNGLPAIPKINNYFPAIREGDYWVRVNDGLGNLKDARAFKTVGEAQRAHETLKKDFPDLDVQKPYLRRKGPYDLNDLSAFEETIRALDRNDPVATAIQKRYAELAGKRGFGRTAIQRRGIPGAMGYEKGMEGVRMSEKVLERYIKRQEDYMANLKVAKLREEFAELPRELKDKMPIAEKYVNEYFRHALGADMSQAGIVRNIMESFSEAAGLGHEMPRQFLKDLSGVASVLWLVTPRFVISQLAQPLQIIPKIMQMRGYDSNVGNPITSYFDGQRRWLGRTEESKAPVEWAKKNGYLESSIAALAGLKATDLQGQRWGLVGQAARYPLSKLEKEMVRGPVFLAFDSALRDSIKSPEKRWQTAAEMMDYYMTHYDSESSPLMYNKAGYLGEAARPLKQYSHNNFGQFLEYAQDVKNKKDIVPLASYMGMQVAVGGLKGVVLVAEAAAAITILNNLFGLDIPTPEQMMYEHGVSDWLVYGGLSKLIDSDVSSSVAAPSMPNMLSLPGIEFGAEAVEATGKYLIKKLKGTETDADAMRALLSVSPNAAKGWIEEAYSQPGGPVPNPRLNMQGNYRRDEDEKLKAQVLGLRSISEAKKNAQVRIAKELLARDIEQKLDAVTAMADRVIRKEPMDPALMQRFVQEGGDPRQLSQMLQKRIKERYLTWDEKQKDFKSMTPQQAHKLQVMKKLMDENQDTLIQGEGGFQKQGLVQNDTESNDERSKKYDRRREQIDTTVAKDRIERAKRLYPGNVNKQLQYLQEEDVRDMERKQRVQEFKSDRLNKKPNPVRMM